MNIVGTKKIIKTILVLFGFIVFLTLTGCGKQTSKAANVIKIGDVVPLTGASAESGVATSQGIDIAVAEINARGGINVGGTMMTVEVIHEDDQSKPEVAVSAAEKLINVDKVDIVIGESIISSCTLAVMELAPNYPSILFTTIECVSQQISDKVMTDPTRYANFFKGAWSSPAYGASVSDSVMYLAGKGIIPFNNKTVAYIVEDTDYGRNNYQYVEEAFKKYGAVTVAFEVVPSGHTDFYAQINKMKQVKPDLVVTCFVPVASGVAYCKQAKELSVEYADFAIVYPSKPGFYDQVGSSADKLFWTTKIVDMVNNPEHKAHADKVLTYFPNQIPTQLHFSGYDVMNMLFAAIEKAGTLDAKAGLADAYLNSDYQGLQARYVFGKNDHTVIAGEDYFPLSVAQVFGQEDFIIWPEKKAARTPVPQR
jgi:branched-chain amino acid transport system substrate-binding protein